MRAGVGRGLRRTAYGANPATGLVEPKYINIFGVPFASRRTKVEKAARPATDSENGGRAGPHQNEFEIRWPNVVRIERAFQPMLTFDGSQAQTLQLDAAQTAQVAELAPILDGQPDVTRVNPHRAGAVGVRVSHRTHHLRDSAERV